MNDSMVIQLKNLPGMFADTIFWFEQHQTSLYSTMVVILVKVLTARVTGVIGCVPKIIEKDKKMKINWLLQVYQASLRIYAKMKTNLCVLILFQYLMR